MHTHSAGLWKCSLISLNCHVFIMGQREKKNPRHSQIKCQSLELEKQLDGRGWALSEALGDLCPGRQCQKRFSEPQMNITKILS